MKSATELAARLRKMVLAAQHHYSPSGEPLRSIVVSPEWLEDMADAADALDRPSTEARHLTPAQKHAERLFSDLLGMVQAHRKTFGLDGAWDVELRCAEATIDKIKATQSRDSADPSSHG